MVKVEWMKNCNINSSTRLTDASKKVYFMKSTKNTIKECLRNMVDNYQQGELKIRKKCLDLKLWIDNRTLVHLINYILTSQIFCERFRRAKLSHTTLFITSFAAYAKAT